MSFSPALDRAESACSLEAKLTQPQPPGQGKGGWCQHKQTGVKSENESAGPDPRSARAAARTFPIFGLCFRCLTSSRNHILLWLCHHRAASRHGMKIPKAVL